jgi:hypothetical protein
VPAFLEIVRALDEAGSGEAANSGDGAAKPSAAAVEPFELVLRGGHRIRVPVDFDGAALRRLVDVLEAR